MPGAPAGKLVVTPSTTPVNSFRIIFNAAFDAPLPILPDRYLVFVDQRHLYQMVDLTDRVRAVIPGSGP